MDINTKLNYYFIDLCQQLFYNELILSKILSNLLLKDLYTCCAVCKQWQIEAKRVISQRSQSSNVFHLFLIDDKEKDLNSCPIDEHICVDGVFPSGSHDRYDFNSNAIKAFVRDLRSIPELVVLLYGGFGEDVKLSQRLSQTDSVRKRLPSNDCQILNLNSSCLIGYPTTSSVPIHKITHFGGLAAVSVIAFPKYRLGIDITVFNGINMREKIFGLDNLKCILLFTTSSIFQDNDNLYSQLNTISNLISNSGHKIAFGGYNSAYFSFNKSDFLNYVLNNFNAQQLETREMIGISFSGTNLRACSIVLNTKRQHKTETRLRKFKKNLGFIPINNKFYETICFMFTDEEKDNAFSKYNSFQTIFPDCKLFGVSGYGQYGYNQWEGIDSHSHDMNGVKLIKKSIKDRVRRKIILNTNMTTFVVINLQKKYY